VDRHRIPKKLLEMKMNWRGLRGRPCIWWIDQIMRDVERREQDWRRVDEVQEWADTRHLETPMQKLTHRCGNNFSKKKCWHFISIFHLFTVTFSSSDNIV
jgi:hypothetical protein